MPKRARAKREPGAEPPHHGTSGHSHGKVAREGGVPNAVFELSSALERMTAEWPTAAGAMPPSKGFEVSLFGEVHPIVAPGAGTPPELEASRLNSEQATEQQAPEMLLHDPAGVFGNSDYEETAVSPESDPYTCGDEDAASTVPAALASNAAGTQQGQGQGQGLPVAGSLSGLRGLNDCDSIGSRVNQALGWLWNNTYFSFVPLYQIMSEPVFAKRILQRLPLTVLHRCCCVSSSFKDWAMAEIRTRPMVVLLGGLTKSWAFVDRPIVLDFPVGGEMEWWQTKKCKVARIRSGAVGLSERRVLVAGGLSASGARVEGSTEILNPYTMEWSTMPPMLSPRLGCGCNSLGAAATRAIYTGGVAVGAEFVDGCVSSLPLQMQCTAAPQIQQLFLLLFFFFFFFFCFFFFFFSCNML
jgi:hypothetical protein